MPLTDAFLLEPHAFEIFVAERKDGVKGTGTLNDPFGINPDSPTAAADFDTLLNDLPANIRINLGPGIFKTQGYTVGATSGWPKKGMRITGSGMDATTLQVENPGLNNSTLFAIGHPLSINGQPNLLDYFELANLTIDTNLTNGTGANVSCGGVRVMGNHLRLHRIKVINWGTKTASRPCVALAVVAADPSVSVPSTIDPVILDCIVVQRSSPTIGPVTGIHVGRKDEVAINAEGFAQGPVIRHCFVDCGWPTASGESRGLSMEWCRGGIVEGNQVHFTQYGVYVEKSSIREIVVRDNFVKNTAKGLFYNLGQLGPTPLNTGSLTRAGTTGTVSIMSHGLAIGDRVKLTTSEAKYFDGVYMVIGVADTDHFTITLTDHGPFSAVVSAAHQVFGANNLLVEGNTVELATGTAGLGIHLYDQKIMEGVPTDVFGDLIVRNNHIHYVDSAFDPSFSGDGIAVNGATNALVMNNVVETAPVPPIRILRCRNVTVQNNRTPSGKLIEGHNTDTAQRYPDLETENDFALVMSLFNRRAR
jgi:hypothetical protein